MSRGFKAIVDRAPNNRHSIAQSKLGFTSRLMLFVSSALPTATVSRVEFLGCTDCLMLVFAWNVVACFKFTPKDADCWFVYGYYGVV